ncbi:MAG: hypothetical protein ACYC8T_21125 [Myxococcaceae bacterium]
MSASESLPDIVVVSDLHLGRGRNGDTGRFHSLEAFFYDEDFFEFCQYLCRESAERGQGLTLVFNGDSFDLLRIEPEPVGADATRREKRYGPIVTPEVAGTMLKDVLAGHPRFAEAVALVLEAGHRVVFLPGNHDLELQWASAHGAVRRAVLAAVRARRGEAAVASADALLGFEPWFFHEPGRVWIEHGCQYDAESSFRFYLRTRAEERADAIAQLERDLPLGSFCQRYLYNAFGALSFIVPSTRANVRYFLWLVANRPGLLLRVLASHGPFGLQFLRRLGRVVVPIKALEQAHLEELEVQATRSKLGPKLEKIEALKNVPLSLVLAVQALVLPVAKLGTLGLVVAFTAAGVWFTLFDVISQLQLGFVLKTLLFLLLNVVTVAGLVAGLFYALIRERPEVQPGPLRRAAQEIVNLLDVSVVTFGHTHDEVLFRLDRPSNGKSWYFNTGTWIAVFSHEILVPRERVQFTFLRVRGHEGALLNWSPGRNRPVPVVLMDE